MNFQENIKSVAAGLSAVSIARSLGIEVYKNWDKKRSYVARISADAYVYLPLMEWLISHGHKNREVKFDSRYHGIKKLYDGDGTTLVNIGGYPCKVKIEKPNMESGKTVIDLEQDISSFLKGVLCFTFTHKEGINALHKFLEELTENHKKEFFETQVYSVAGFSGWIGRRLHDRPMSSVFLPPGVKEDLISDLESFINNEHHYADIGIPWHRGYLFYGPPGNGKSSLVSAIASTYKMNLYNLPLSSVKSDAELSQKIADVGNNSILLLEDIDIFSNSMKREQAQTGPTLAGLLNCLDGVSTPHGLITFMTTNVIESLDPALIRPGRIDKRIEILPPITYQIKEMFLRCYNQELEGSIKDFSSMASVSEIFKKYPLDANGARLSLLN